jgi:hypothetical protein
MPVGYQLKRRSFSTTVRMKLVCSHLISSTCDMEDFIRARPGRILTHLTSASVKNWMNSFDSSCNPISARVLETV